MKNIKHKIGLILNDDTPETPLKREDWSFYSFFNSCFFFRSYSGISCLIELKVPPSFFYHRRSGKYSF